MEYKEFDNPLENDYDLKKSLDGFSEENKKDVIEEYYSKQLFDLVGILEDVSEFELQQNYGISVNEYFHPTLETIQKVKKKLGESETKKHK